MRAVSVPSPIPPRHISPIMQKFWQHQKAASRGREIGQVTQIKRMSRKLRHDWQAKKGGSSSVLVS